MGVFVEHKEEFDIVTKPKHYNELYNKEVIDIIKYSLTEEQFFGYLLGNVLKYRLRAGLKGKDTAQEDFEKSNWYLNRIKSLKGG